MAIEVFISFCLLFTVESVWKRYKTMNANNEIMPRLKKTVTLPKDVIEWLEKQIEERRFSNISHGIEYALYQLMKKEREKE